MIRTATPLVLLLALSHLAAQNLCEGTGAPGAYLRSSTARIGSTVEADLGSPTQPNGFALLLFSTGIGPTVSPFLGPVCIDVTSPVYTALFFLTDGSGNAHWSAPIPNVPGWFNFAPFFCHAATLETAGISVSKTVRLSFTLPNSFDPLPTGPQVGSHTATALFAGPADRRYEVLLAGGASGSIISPTPTAATTLFSPLERTFRPGPSLNLPRSGHRAVRLLDGRVLITGGATFTNLGTATCELYDPATNTISLGPSMSAPRLTHAMTLLSDGRVLVSGGFADWSQASIQFVGMLNTAQDTTEIYDPASNSWTAGPVMASKRAGHSQTLLPDGRVLIVGGVSGGQVIPVSLGSAANVPTFTATCEFFAPTGNTLAPAAALPMVSPLTANSAGRGFHGASVLPNGNVLLTGGAASIGGYGAASCTNVCLLFDGVNWTPTASMTAPVAFHTQETDPATGHALVMGGFTGEFGFTPAVANCGVHDGVTFTATANLGLHALLPATATPRATHSCTPLPDGTFLVWGGQTPTVNSTITTYASGYVYVK